MLETPLALAQPSNQIRRNFPNSELKVHISNSKKTLGNSSTVSIYRKNLS